MNLAGLAGDAGDIDLGFVFRIDAKKTPKYEGFEIESAAQEMIEAVLNGDFTEDVAGLISNAAKAAKDYETVKKIMSKKRDLDKAEADKQEAAETDEQKAAKKQQEIQDLQNEIQNLLKRVSDKTQVDLLTSTLNL